MKKMKSIVLCGLLSTALMASTLVGCGSNKVDGNAAAATINDETVKVGLANFHLRSQEAIMNGMMELYGFGTPGNIWDSAASDENFTTYGEQFKDSLKDGLTELVLLRQKAPEYGVEITAEDQEKIDSAASEIYSVNAEVWEPLGITEDSIKEYLELSVYKTKMRTPVLADQMDEIQNVSDEEANKSTVTYSRLALTLESDDETMPITAEEAETANVLKIAEAEQLLETVLAADDPASFDMDAAAEEIDTEFYTGTYSYTADGDALGEEVMAAAATLKDGEVYKEVIVTENYYYILRMDAIHDEEATEANRQTIISDREQEAYDNLIAEWKEASTIEYTSAWDDLAITDKNTYTTKSEDETTEDTATEE